MIVYYYDLSNLLIYIYFFIFFFHCLKFNYKIDEQEFRKLCSDGNIGEVQKLLQNPQLNINCQDNDGETPFYVTCGNGHIEIVKLLLNDKRTSIRKKTNKGKTAFDIAKTNNHSEIMKLVQELDTGNFTKRVINKNEIITIK